MTEAITQIDTYCDSISFNLKAVKADFDSMPLFAIVDASVKAIACQLRGVPPSKSLLKQFRVRV